MGRGVLPFPLIRSSCNVAYKAPSLLFGAGTGTGAGLPGILFRQFGSTRYRLPVVPSVAQVARV